MILISLQTSNRWSRCESKHMNQWGLLPSHFPAICVWRYRTLFVIGAQQPKPWRRNVTLVVVMPRLPFDCGTWMLMCSYNGLCYYPDYFTADVSMNALHCGVPDIPSVALACKRPKFGIFLMFELFYFFFFPLQNVLGGWSRAVWVAEG